MVIKTPKLFWTDIGIWRQLTGIRNEITGQLYETMVVGEIIKWFRTRQLDVGIFFYRTQSGMEMDLLIETASGLIGIEIKSRAIVGQKDIRSMRAVAEILGRRWCGGIVVYTGNEIALIESPDIWAVPSRRLFQPAQPQRFTLMLNNYSPVPFFNDSGKQLMEIGARFAVTESAVTQASRTMGDKQDQSKTRDVNLENGKKIPLSIV